MEDSTTHFETVEQRRRGARLLKIHFQEQPRNVQEYFRQQEEIRLKENKGTRYRYWSEISRAEEQTYNDQFQEYLYLMANKDSFGTNDESTSRKPDKRQQGMTPPPFMNHLGELNDDSLATIMGYISCPKTLQLRLVNKNWDRTIMSSNYLWDQFLERDFFGSLDKGKILEHEKNQMNKGECLEYKERKAIDESDTIPSNQNVAFSSSVSKITYMSLYGMIPVLAKPLKRQGQQHLNSINYSIEMRLQEISEYKLVSFKGSTQVHKLALILSLLNANGYVPSILLEMVKIGRQADHILIPLSQFCYAVLTGREGEVYKGDDNVDISPSDLTTNNQSMRDLDQDEIIGLFCRDKLDNEIAISPNIEDGFVPFVYYNYMKPIVAERNRCCWASDEMGWCPQFMNASFSWFYFAEFETHYDPQTSILTIEKKKARTGVS